MLVLASVSAAGAAGPGDALRQQVTSLTARAQSALLDLYAIDTKTGRLLARIPVGAAAHHLCVRPDGRQVWIALGESASTIVVVDTSDPARPRVTGQFDPGFPVHDLLFTPDGRRVWITPSTGADVGVFSARSRRMRFQVPGGAPPQHVAFGGGRAYVASGYGSQIELVSLDTGRVLKVAHAVYGSFNLDVAGGFVAVASLLRGTLSVYDDRLQLLRVRRIAPAARDVAISRLVPAATRGPPGQLP